MDGWWTDGLMGKDYLGIKDQYLPKTCVTDEQASALCILPLCPKKQRDAFCQKVIAFWREGQMNYIMSPDQSFICLPIAILVFKAVCSGNYEVTLSVVSPSLLCTLRRRSFGTLLCVSSLPCCSVHCQPPKLSL